jgi:hypothetical protein
VLQVFVLINAIEVAVMENFVCLFRRASKRSQFDIGFKVGDVIKRVSINEGSSSAICYDFPFIVLQFHVTSV